METPHVEMQPGALPPGADGAHPVAQGARADVQFPKRCPQKKPWYVSVCGGRSPTGPPPRW